MRCDGTDGHGPVGTRRTRSTVAGEKSPSAGKHLLVCGATVASPSPREHDAGAVSENLGYMKVFRHHPASPCTAFAGPRRQDKSQTTAASDTH